jgi:hypothetical protein
MASEKFQGPKHIVDKMFRENFRFFRKGILVQDHLSNSCILFYTG